MIIRKKKLVFIHVPKTAGSTVIHSLLKDMIGRDTSGSMSSLPQNVKVEYGLTGDMKHAPAIKLRNVVGDDWDDFYKFAFIRNPWDRTVSAFHWVKRKAKDYSKIQFDEYVKLMHKHQHDVDHYLYPMFRTQTSFVTDNSSIIVNDIFKFEELNKSITVVNKKVGTNIQINKKHNTTPGRKPYKEYYTSELQDIIGECCVDDIKLFNYTF